MNDGFVKKVCRLTALGACMGSNLCALEVDDTSNLVFDLYFFGNGESGVFGTLTGDSVSDAAKQTSGTVADSNTYYWSNELKQAMVNAVNTWTTAIATPYDTESNARKLRIGFFLDDGSTAGGVKTTSVAVILAYMSGSLKGKEKHVIFGRSIDAETHKKSVTVCVFNLLLIFIAVIIICALENFALKDICFEVFSAIGTTGMTTGITRDLSVISKIILIILMYCGRIGSISFALAILEKRAQAPVSYPTEAITVG